MPFHVHSYQNILWPHFRDHIYTSSFLTVHLLTEVLPIYFLVVLNLVFFLRVNFGISYRLRNIINFHYFLLVSLFRNGRNWTLNKIQFTFVLNIRARLNLFVLSHSLPLYFRSSLILRKFFFVICSLHLYLLGFVLLLLALLRFCDCGISN